MIIVLSDVHFEFIWTALTLLENQAAMSETRIARIKVASYENVTADCPWCGKESIFNRASDLRTF
jgi:hypothetical protein